MYKKGGIFAARDAILFIALKLPLIIIYIFIVTSVELSVVAQYEQSPSEIRGQILETRLSNCFGGSVWQEDLLTEDQFNSCYPVDANQRNAYPAQVVVEYSESTALGGKKTISLNSANYFNLPTNDFTYPVVLELENEKKVTGTVTYKMQEVRLS